MNIIYVNIIDTILLSLKSVININFNVIIVIILNIIINNYHYYYLFKKRRYPDWKAMYLSLLSVM